MNPLKPNCAQIAGILLCLGLSQVGMAQTLSGGVYEGTVGDTSQPLTGVMIRLYGSNKSGSLGVVIDETTTDANGQYSLDASTVYELYTIVETDPAGYVSVGATSVDGKVIDENRILYTHPLAGKVLEKNRFWDAKEPANKAPVAKAGGPYSGYVNDWIIFDGSESYDPDQDDKIISWQWDMDNDGQYDDATGETVKWQWDKPASGTVALKVMDTQQATDTDTATYEVKAQNQSPVADAGGPYAGQAGEWITFDGSKSYDPDPDDEIVVWQWDMDNDGQYDAVGEIIQWNWDDPTSGTVRLEVIDAHGSSSTDFADFSVEPMFGEYDYGDAPTSPAHGYSYPTLRSANGARHLVDADLCMGSRVDVDENGQPDLAALGDDTDAGGDDEDGIEFLTDVMPGQEARFELLVTNNKGSEQRIKVGCWLDVDASGQWALSGELVESWSLTASPGVNTWELGFEVPLEAVPGLTCARFRLYRVDLTGPAHFLSPFGPAGQGEVEDYMVEIQEAEALSDYGDAPDPEYPTLLASDGARHRVKPGLSLGRYADPEIDAQPNGSASGDDAAGLDDEDGVGFLGDLVPGHSTWMTIHGMNFTAEDQEIVVAGWIDFDRDGLWGFDEVVAVIGPVVLPSGEAAVWRPAVPVPVDASLGQTYARFRLYRVTRGRTGEIIAPGILPTGNGGEGEVEDHAVMIGEVIQREDFDEDPGWPTEGGWAFGAPSGGGGTHGHPDPNAGCTGANVYGVNLEGDYDPTPGGAHFLTAGPFDCTGYSEVTLRFARWLNSDASPLVWNVVHVSNQGRVWHVVWQSPEGETISDDGWQSMEYDISGVASRQSEVYVRWGYRVTAGADPYSGWNLDDVVLWGIPDEPVHFTDARVKAAVEGALLITDPTPRDMLALTNLAVEDAEIWTLDGLEYAANLETLHLGGNHILDVRPLGALVNLTELHLHSNEIRDISPLAGLIHLTDLTLGENHIRDISALAGMTRLTYLGLVRNLIADIRPLAGLRNLEQLWLNQNQIVDINPLADMTTLTVLALDDNPLSNVSCTAIIPIIRANNPGIWLQSSCPP